MWQDSTAVSQPRHGLDVVDRPLARVSCGHICRVKRDIAPTSLASCFCLEYVAYLYSYMYVLVPCVKAQVLPAELCPLSVDHLLWTYSVLVCVGIKGGLMGIKRKVKV